MAEFQDVLPKRKWVIPLINMITIMPVPDHLDELLCHLQCFSKTKERNIEATSSQTQCTVFKRLKRHIGD